MPDYFTLEELRALPDVGDATRFPPERVEVVAARVVAIIEQTVGVAFVGRTITNEMHDGGRAVVLREPHVQSVTSATENGAPVTDPLTATVGGVLVRGTGGRAIPWAPGVQNIAVTYVHGYSVTPPADIKEAALQATRWYLLANSAESSIDARRTSLNTDMGVLGFSIADADHPFGYPEIDAVVIGWRDRLDVFGFA